MASLIAPANDAAVQDSRTIGSIKEEGSKPKSKIISVLLIRKDSLLSIPRFQVEPGIAHKPT